MRILTIYLEDEDKINSEDGHPDDQVVERVLELIQQGYTSGYEPRWEIKETE